METTISPGEKKTDLFGKMKETLHITGDILKPIEEEWCLLKNNPLSALCVSVVKS